MSRQQNQQHSEWIPRTSLGLLVASGKINSMDEVYENGLRIQESEIIKRLLPEIRSQVVHT
jgi:small subunit ribosomal protein S5